MRFLHITSHCLAFFILVVSNAFGKPEKQCCLKIATNIDLYGRKDARNKIVGFVKIIGSDVSEPDEFERHFDGSDSNRGPGVDLIFMRLVFI